MADADSPEAAERLAGEVDELLDAWMGRDRHRDGQERIAAILAAAEARGDRRPQLASDLIQAIVEDLSRDSFRTIDERLALAAEHHRRCTEVGWERYTAIASARHLMWQAIKDVGKVDEVVAELSRRGARIDPSLPAFERFWYDHGCAFAMANAERYGEALEAAVHAADIARESGLDLLQTEAAITLSFVFLSVGDLEGAGPVLDAGVKPALAGDWRPFPLFYNALLVYAMTKRFEDAQELLDASPWFVELSDSWGGAVRALIGLIQMGLGKLDEAVALVRDRPDTPTNAWSGPNRAWIEGQVLLAAGHHEEALEVLEEFIAGPHATDLNPLNGTQVYRALCEARDAAGDAAGALAALRESQSRCFDWVAESVVSRLQAIRVGSGAERLGNDPVLDQRSARVRTTALAALAQASDIIDIDRLNAAIVTADAEADRDHYLAHVSHDMRNTLHGVMAMISMLMLSDLDDKQRQYAEIAETSAETLLALCNDVIDLANIDAGRLEFCPEPVDVATVIEGVVAPFAVRAAASDVAVEIDLERGLPRKLWVDPLRLKQIVLNLVSNAVKFTTEGSINIGVRWTPHEQGRGELKIVVVDTGRGIAAEALPHLFQEFAQVDVAGDSALGGSGLGLAVTRQLVDLAGGRIEVESQVGVGSTFWVSLPLSERSSSLFDG